MNIQTGRKGSLPADNFSSFTLHQRLFSRSTVKTYFHNRYSFMTDQEKIANPSDQYGRNGGVEFNYSNKSGTILGWTGGHLSWKPELNKNNHFVSAGGGYFGEKFYSFIDFNAVGNNYYSDIGFVNRIENYDALRDTTFRRGFRFFYNETGYTFYMDEKSSLNRIAIGTENFLAFDQHGHFNERNNVMNVTFEFKSTSFIKLQIENNTIQLLYPFRFVTDEEKQPLPAEKYHFSSLGFSYMTDARKNFSFSADAKYGKYYNADFTQVTMGFITRNQPYATFSLNMQYNNLKFPNPYGQQEFLLIAPQIEWNFSNNVFWTSFLQYNSQENNFNVNSRLQYRYKAMSDIYLVYSDNYFTDALLKNKNRALVLKINYWLNV